MAKKMAATGIKLLWGTANLFSHPRYAGGAATSPDPRDLRLGGSAGARCAWRRPIGWAGRTMCCGAAAKAMTRC